MPRSYAWGALVGNALGLTRLCFLVVQEILAADSRETRLAASVLLVVAPTFLVLNMLLSAVPLLAMRGARWRRKGAAAAAIVAAAVVSAVLCTTLDAGLGAVAASYARYPGVMPRPSPQYGHHLLLAFRQEYPWLLGSLLAGLGTYWLFERRRGSALPGT